MKSIIVFLSLTFFLKIWASAENVKDFVCSAPDFSKLKISLVVKAESPMIALDTASEKCFDRLARPNRTTASDFHEDVIDTCANLRCL